MKYRFVVLKNLYFLKDDDNGTVQHNFWGKCIESDQNIKKIMYFSSLELVDGTKCV